MCCNRYFKIVVEDNSVAETMFLSCFTGFHITMKKLHTGKCKGCIKVDISLLDGEYSLPSVYYCLIKGSAIKNYKKVARSFVDDAKGLYWINKDVDPVIKATFEKYQDEIIIELAENLKIINTKGIDN